MGKSFHRNSISTLSQMLDHLALETQKQCKLRVLHEWVHFLLKECASYIWVLLAKQQRRAYLVRRWTDIDQNCLTL